MAEVLELNDNIFEDEIKNSEVPYIVDFWAAWCGPCRIMSPVIEEIAEKNEGKIKVGKINVDENPNTAAKYSVMSIPTFILFEGGEPKKTIVGAMSKEKLLSQLDL